MLCWFAYLVSGPGQMADRMGDEDRDHDRAYPRNVEADHESISLCYIRKIGGSRMWSVHSIPTDHIYSIKEMKNE